VTDVNGKRIKLPTKTAVLGGYWAGRGFTKPGLWLWIWSRNVRVVPVPRRWL